MGMYSKLNLVKIQPRPPSVQKLQCHHGTFYFRFVQFMFVYNVNSLYILYSFCLSSFDSEYFVSPSTVISLHYFLAI